MSIIAAGATVNLQFHFVYDNLLVEPDTITGEIYLDNIFQENFSASFVSTGVYNYSWITTVDGSFEIRLTGEFNNSTPDIIHREYFLIGDIEPSSTLSSSYVISLLGVLNPVYVDPELILEYYPSGDLSEITEIIHKKSLDLESRVGCTNISPLTADQHDYVIASTMCQLSRIYGLTNSGLNGFSSADSFKLGDLEVDKGSGGNSSAAGKYDTGNAASWCELASALRSQLANVNNNLKPVVPGAAFAGKIPSRILRSSDY